MSFCKFLGAFCKGGGSFSFLGAEGCCVGSEGFWSWSLGSRLSGMEELRTRPLILMNRDTEFKKF